MPKPSNLENKINLLVDVAVGDYKVDLQFMHQMSERAKMINLRAERAGFIETDVFMAEDGSLTVVAYLGEGSIEVVLLEMGDYDVFIEYDHHKIGFKPNKTAQQVFNQLEIWGRIWGNNLWHSVEFYQGSPMTLSKNDLMLVPSGVEPKEDYQSSIQSVWTRRTLAFASS